ncbi:MAG: hypothetical protein ACE5DM_03450 [Candidatus Nanoarchaeia archaeon]
MKRLLPILIIIIFLTGCAPQQTVEPVNIEPEKNVEIIKPCPESCDDGNPQTEDICNEQTGNECEHKKVPATESAEDIMRDINALLKLKNLYIEEKAGKVAHFISYGEPDKHEQIVVDVLDYDLDTGIDKDLYFNGQFKSFVMKPINEQKEAYENWIKTLDYHFEGKGFYTFVDDNIDEHVEYNNVSYLDDLGYYETVYGSIDIGTANTEKTSDDHTFKEKQFFIDIPFTYRLSIICKPDIVIHLYAKQEQYRMRATTDILKNQEKSWILNHYRDVREDMIKKANKIVEICR